MSLKTYDASVNLVDKTASVVFKNPGKNGSTITVHFKFEPKAEKKLGLTDANRVIYEAQQILKHAADKMKIRRPPI